METAGEEERHFGGDAAAPGSLDTPAFDRLQRELLGASSLSTSSSSSSSSISGGGASVDGGGAADARQPRRERLTQTRTQPRSTDAAAAANTPQASGARHSTQSRRTTTSHEAGRAQRAAAAAAATDDDAGLTVGDAHAKTLTNTAGSCRTPPPPPPSAPQVMHIPSHNHEAPPSDTTDPPRSLEAAGDTQPFDESQLLRATRIARQGSLDKPAGTRFAALDPAALQGDDLAMTAAPSSPFPDDDEDEEEQEALGAHGKRATTEPFQAGFGYDDDEEGGESDDGHSASGGEMDARAHDDATVTSPVRLSPTTPATVAGSKRDRQGHVVRFAGGASTTTTPARDLAAMFAKAGAGFNNAGRGLSQVFQDTQAVSSPPLPSASRGALVFERPSPDFRPLAQSSPGPEDSPVRVKATALPRSAKRRCQLQRAHTDPRDVYISMADSQQRRGREREELQSKLEWLEEEEEEDLTPDQEIKRAELRRKRAALREETANLLRPAKRLSTTGDTTRASPKKSSSSMYSSLRTPATVAVSKTIVISDDTPISRANAGRADDGDVDELDDGENGVDYDDDDDDDHVNDNDDDDDDDDDRAVEYNEYTQEVVEAPLRGATALSALDHDHISNISPLEERAQTRNLLAAQPAHSSFGGRRVASQSLPSDHSGGGAGGYTLYQAVQVQCTAPSPMPPRPVLVSSGQSRTYVAQSQQDYSAGSALESQGGGAVVPLSQGGASQTSELSSLPHAPPLPFETTRSPKSRDVVSLPSSPPLLTSIEDQGVDESPGEDEEVAANAAQGRIHESPGKEPFPFNSSTIHQTLQQCRPEVETRRVSRRRVIADTSPTSSSDHILNGDDASAVPVGSDSGNRQIQSKSTSNATTTYHTAPTHSKQALKTDRSLQRHRPSEELQLDLDANEIDIPQIMTEQDRELAAMLGHSPVRPHRVDATARQGALRRVSRRKPPTPVSLDSFRIDDDDDSSQSVPSIRPPTPSPLTPPAVKEVTLAEIVSRMADGKPRDERMSVQTHNEAPSTQRHTEERLATSNTLPSRLIVRPSRVLAKFKDARRMAYWPATCLGGSRCGQFLRVQFDDGNLDNEVLKDHVRSLELRPGDNIRIDEDGYRKDAYVVQELRRRPSNEAPRAQPELDTDIYGQNWVVATAKPTGGAGDQSRVEVSLSKVYVNTSLLPQFNDRPFTLAKVAAADERLHTPITGLSVQTTPSSRNRRRTLQANVPEQTKPDPSARPSSGLFAGMAFAISFSGRLEGNRASKLNVAEEKADLTECIRRHGGQVLPDGFHGLFDNVDAPSGLETISSAPRIGGDDEAHTGLRLSAEFANMRFAALVADSHSRSEKYMQALALDIPCLSSRWVRDCVARAALLPWPRYLLAAGESALLGGAVRSRTLSAAPEVLGAGDALVLLRDTIARRPRLFRGQDVLLIVDGAREADKRRTFAFLTRALGAHRIERAATLAAARARLLPLPRADDASGNHHYWDWVYVGDEPVAAAAARLAGAAPPARESRGRPQQQYQSRRRTTNGTTVGSIVAASASASNGNPGSGQLSAVARVGGRDVRVVGDEFVVQSLIAGALLG